MLSQALQPCTCRPCLDSCLPLLLPSRLAQPAFWASQLSSPIPHVCFAAAFLPASQQRRACWLEGKWPVLNCCLVTIYTKPSCGCCCRPCTRHMASLRQAVSVTSGVSPVQAQHQHARHVGHTRLQALMHAIALIAELALRVGTWQIWAGCVHVCRFGCTASSA